jgi:hypothetical protein
MALTQTTIDPLATHSPKPLPVQPGNVIALRPARALMHVTLPPAQLRALLHSPLGVYVVGTDIVREEVLVQLDIATEDLDFTLHTLISTVPAALIGPLKRRVHSPKSARL